MDKSADYLKLAGEAEIKKLLEENEEVLFSDGLFKFNQYDWKQARNILITSKYIYNLKKKSMKRRISLLSVGAMTISESKDSQEFVIHVPSEYDYRYSSPRRDEILELIARLYSGIHSKPLPKYMVPHVFLKEFTTTKSEKKKNIFRIPDETYRMSDSSSSTSDSSKDDNDAPEESKVQSKVLYQKDSAIKEVGLSSFKIIRKIGKGSFGIIYLVEMIENGNIFALKQLRKDLLIKTDALMCAKLEKEVLKRAQHPFLVGLDYVFQTSVNIYFVMKFYRGGELYRHLLIKKRFSEDTARFYAAQIALALGELHRNNIIYRDMKPENILMDVDGYIALADYGLAKIVEENKSTTTFCGTPEYLAPEMVNEAGHNKQVDWWGLGVLLYELIVGVPPFRNRNHHVLFQFIASKEVVFPPEKYNIPVSDEAKDVILKLLKKKPTERLGAKGDVKEVMEHPFFKSIDVEKLLKKEIVPEYKPPVNESDKYDVQNFGHTDGFKEEPVESVDKKTMAAIKKKEVIFK